MNDIMTVDLPAFIFEPVFGITAEDTDYLVRECHPSFLVRSMKEDPR